ncbi:helix-turn-helix domain-containing protein [Streptococcus ovuberis]|uniref:Helix-turn-helix domain-containing protein n=1 Tax=Streptococcus ovuberis TaxID=1936207 RepID=A0A7X6S1I5_9STRE|nr:helix-turn-helix domain-containing protein [Streptococcus ovuberis]
MNKGNIKFGPMIRELRKDRGMTLTELAEGLVAKSQLSRFERGESELGAGTFYQLLNRLQVLFDEFLVFAGMKEDFRRIILEIAPYYAERQVMELYRILEEVERDGLAPSFLDTMIKALIRSLDEQEPGPNDEELSALTNYLFGVEYWGQYEMTLLGNCAQLMTYETLYLLTMEVIKKRQLTLPYDPGNRKLVIQLAINCLEASIERGFLDRAKVLIGRIEEILIVESEFFEKTIFEFMKGYYEVRLGISSGKERIESALTVLKLMAPEGIYQAYQEQFHGWAI